MTSVFVRLTKEELELLHRVMDDRLKNVDIADEWNLNMKVFIKVDERLKYIKENLEGDRK